MRLYVIDNIDSFTFNLVHLCHQVALERGITLEIAVGRSDEVSIKTIERFNPDWILISPGPGHPQEATLAIEALNTFAGKTPILGVCLGMQVMAHWQGLSVVRGEPAHGKQFDVYRSSNLNHPMLDDLPEPFSVIRYHSLHIPQTEIAGQSNIRVLATCQDTHNTVMAIDVKTNNPNAFVWGVQFHPESIGSTCGVQLLHNVFQAVTEGVVAATAMV